MLHRCATKDSGKEALSTNSSFNFNLNSFRIADRILCKQDIQESALLCMLVCKHITHNGTSAVPLTISSLQRRSDSQAQSAPYPAQLGQAARLRLMLHFHANHTANAQEQA